MMNKPIPIDKNSIPPHRYQGYYWYSNKVEPEVINDQPIDPAIFKDIPFIVEGHFYAEEAGISIQVKNVDGDYLICQVKLPEEDRKQYFLERHIGHDITHKGFRIMEAWEPVTDPTCLEGMESLELAWTVFAGFVK